MRLMIGFDVEIPDAVADQIIRSAGVELAEADYPLALALAMLSPFPAQLREYLLSPDHKPIPLNSWTLLTTERSASKVGLMLSTQNEDSPVWTSSPPKKSQPASPAKPKKAPRPAKRGSASRSTSKPPSTTGTS